MSVSVTNPKIVLSGITPIKLKKDQLIKLDLSDKLKSENVNIFKLETQRISKRETIYETSDASDPLLGCEFKKIVIWNQYHSKTDSCHTTALFIRCNNQTVIKTSDYIINMIGQKNYNDIFVALCSVINKDVKIKAILALLADKDKINLNINKISSKTDNSCQTDESNVEVNVPQVKKRIKRRQVPHVVKSDTNTEVPNVKTVEEANIEASKLLDLKDCLSEDSNFSTCSNISNLSINSDILAQQEKMLLKSTETCTELEIAPTLNIYNFSKHSDPVDIRTYEGYIVSVPLPPEDQFHFVTPSIWKHITDQDKIRLVKHQRYVDWKLCLECNDEGLKPIHIAVIHDDIELLNRQAHVLNIRGSSVDVPTTLGLTALQLSVSGNKNNNCTKALLAHNADPLLCDNKRRNAVHLAADVEYQHLEVILQYISGNARKIIKDYDKIQFDGYENSSDKEISKHVLLHVSNIYDGDGYTPLGLACKAGIYENVKALLDRCPETVNTVMNNSGNTPFFLAVSEARLKSIANGNMELIPENFKNILELLIKFDASIEIQNYSGFKVFDVLQEQTPNVLATYVTNLLSSKHLINHPYLCKIQEIQSCDKNVKMMDQKNVINKPSRSTNPRIISGPINNIIIERKRKSSNSTFKSEIKIKKS